MKSNWLKHLNPFHFERWYLLSAIWGNFVLSVLLLGLVGEIVDFWNPAIDAASRAHISVVRLNSDWNVVQLRKMVFEQDSFIHRVIRDFVIATNSCALLGCVFVVVILMNAFYMYKAYQMLAIAKSDAATKP